MSTPRGLRAFSSRIASALARSRADRALRLSTQVWGELAYADLGKHAIAADDAAFLSDTAARHGRYDEAWEHAGRAQREYQLVRRMVRDRGPGQRPTR
ncbi:hypothetical protein [Nocardioides sp. CFH 31398]|uniref:hypothetical protein n=1 Tax=Nocardioides sp. CFH 31398 TaxID=2919579 RepID=UPI001F055A02|nr:hypothetical protein [Nocardioides sp. CFH 31398]MCH1866055.1 hypothetical protein [Nocardioides sp. CFH 31398]